ncbi:hypothetical protein QJS10_CPA09g00664 [Acorus calamus]|uniref:Bifunctional inhibitor/plant lipid transfer protein/seed storage helical domain-containing protein n=2 Tax=Acorus calamus TaxID=4465 RepID=A0AAV9E3Z8_ACOCL|nr:hypothetical protein QJS10_CPA09g00664 [Acorus calamus]
MEMTKKGVTCVLILLVAMAYTFIGPAQAQVSCSKVDSEISQCGSYLTGRATSPSAECCNGVKSIHQAVAGSAQGRKETCDCIRRTMSTYSDLRDEAARALPGRCGIKAGILISRDVNCSR